MNALTALTRLSVAVLGFASLGLSTEAASPIGYTKFKHGSAWYHEVKADLNSLNVSTETMHRRGTNSFWQVVRPAPPTVAVTGTFFGAPGGFPVADVLVDGNLVAQGNRGSAIAVDWTGKVAIFDTRYHQPVNWARYRFALRGTVRLMTRGRVMPDPKAQRFRDRRIWGRASRVAAGLRKDGKLVLLATTHAVTLRQLGYAMKARGVVDAVNLDGGSSTLLYYRGRLIVPPKRRVSNLLVLRERPLMGPAPIVAYQPNPFATDRW